MLGAALLAAATDAPAQEAGSAITFSCAFKVECLAPGGCSDTTFEAQLAVDPRLTGSAPDAVLSSVSGSVDLTLYADAFGDMAQTGATFAGKGAGAFHTIAREPDGDAVYTVTMEDGPLVITYLGRCEAPE
ncbi:hypothetical protein ILP92_09285 [Maribius pontilimi]|uniref:Uncharacterized protein n=1 Tax=Palleronia pontilimi TaxID=1964209 RepID=A0A934MH22_9RHOB|nr:hypothetical protein [Palleronia pontilimi]MBJ3762934.1 hypothetical protein [Palleronia pontilimi]